MSAGRRKRKAARSTPAHKRDWIDFLRIVLLVEAAAIAIAIVALRLTDPFDQSFQMWFLAFVMMLWTTLPLLLSYLNSRPARPKDKRVVWVLLGLVGGTVLLGWLISQFMDPGDSTAALGLVALPIYHWGLIVTVMLGILVLGWIRGTK